MISIFLVSVSHLLILYLKPFFHQTVTGRWSIGTYQELYDSQEAESHMVCTKSL